MLKYRLQSQTKKFLFNFFIWIFCSIELLIIIWGSLALYYSEIPFLSLRYVLIVLYLLIGFSAIWLIRVPYKGLFLQVLFGVIYIALLGYWLTIQPTHDRIWRTDMAKMPRAFIEGDKVRITNFRNFDYQTRHNFTPHYEEREVQISHLVSVDFYLSYWMDLPIAHTFVSFNFDNAPPVTISIEARFEQHESYQPIASLFKQFELIYIVGDEYDIVRVRTNFRKERVYRYPINISATATRRLFLVYLERINELADHPEFYHLLSNNCTINIIRYANRSGRVGRLNFRHIINGFSDRYLYLVGAVDTRIPFRELREKAYINDLAEVATNPDDFYKDIRKRLPSYNLKNTSSKMEP